jgi:hypothetical protein
MTSVAKRIARSSAYVDLLCARGLATPGEYRVWSDYLVALNARHGLLDARDRVEPRRVTPLSVAERVRAWAAAEAETFAPRSHG